MNRFGRLGLPLVLLALTLALPRVGRADDDVKKAVKRVEKATDATALLEGKEHQLLDAFKQRNSEQYLKMVDAHGWSIDPSGIIETSTIPEMMKDFEIRNYTIDSFKT